MLVKIPGDSSPKAAQYTGALVDMSSEERTQVVNQLEQDADASGVFLPFMLDTSDFRQNGFIALGIGLAVLLLCLFGLFTALSRIVDHTKHPIMRALKRFGDPQQLSEQINQEMSNPHDQVGKVHLSANWLVVPGAPSGVLATRLDDIVWAYGKVTQHRTYGVPTGKSYAAQVWDRHGKTVTITGKEQVMNDTLKALYQHAPWVIMGYNPQVVAAWRSNRASIIAAVDQRRGQVKNPAPSGTGSQPA